MFPRTGGKTQVSEIVFHWQRSLLGGSAVAPQISQNSNTGEHRGLQCRALVKTVSISKREQGCRWLTVSHIFRLLRILQKLGGVYKILQATLARWRQTVFECCDVTTFVHFVVAALADGL